jgi:hypothetical protein
MTKTQALSQVVGEPAGTGHAYFVDAGWSRGAAPVASGHR